MKEFVDSPSPPISRKSSGPLARVSRHLVMKKLEALQGGSLRVADEWGITRFGDATELQAAIDVRRPAFYRSAAIGGTLAVAESYIRGDWDCEQLTELFRLLIRNRDATRHVDGGLARLAGASQRALHRWRDNSRRGSRRNISAHYDLGNDFFRLWLDDSLAYSSGIFPSSRASLREASIEKIDRACRKLDLQASDHVLEIGGGWGGFAIHAAANYGCRVTTTTISQEQFTLAQRRIDGSGLGDRITLLNSDYRDLCGRFDKLVSIEMIEAVGHRYFDAFFDQCGRLLRSSGSLLLQAIVMPERHYDDYLRSVDFIQRYIFPGGCLPSLSAMLESVGRTGSLRLVHAEDFAPHYAETLRRWRTNFEEAIPEVHRLGYGEHFVRLWRYYLCYCEAAFEERSIGVMQLQFDGAQCRRDPLRVTALAAAGYHQLEPLYR